VLTAILGLIYRYLVTPPMPLMITKLLFICSQNRWRSLTAETLAHGIDGFTARSAGTERGARVRVTEGHLRWADLVFVMEKRHLERLRSKFPEAVQGKQIICLHIPDDYGYMDPQLIELLKIKLSPYIDVPG
jgi:predicted protein tyrosine phosphatase